ncbi:MAG: alpha-D-ribose 1-methylphosphonate 5-triphosphate diphosphatase [Pseudomonadota bacterium]
MVRMEQIFTNARIVLPDEIITGSVKLANGKIADVSTGCVQHGENIEGDYILPGLVELHTDHLENHYFPRPGVRWNELSAIQAHDAQIAASGITTVFDCLRMGTDPSNNIDDFIPGEMRGLAEAIVKAGNDNRLRAEHYFHLRCEVSADNAAEEFDGFTDIPNVRLASLMDHSPGQRQFQTMEQYTLYYKTKRGLSDEEFKRFCEDRLEKSARNSDRHRKHIASSANARGISVASHDDATLDHVEEAKRDGVVLAEFPTSIEAANASHRAGMSVLMGAPNMVRGKSHSGNIAARELAENGILDVMSSDYIPFSLIQAPFVLSDNSDAVTLTDAIRMVTKTPAETVGLNDRGAIETGRRADLVRVSRHDKSVPLVRSVWREGKRVA